MRKIMRAILHDRAPNTYYGQWPGKKPLFAGLERRPLPIVSSLRAPDSGPLTFRSEISQGIARRRVGNCVSTTKKNLLAWRRDALRATTAPLIVLLGARLSRAALLMLFWTARFQRAS